MAQLSFHSWQRSKVMDGATESTGRLKGRIPLTLDDIADDRPAAPLEINVVFRGPGDIAALKPSAIRHTAPRDSTADNETTKLVHVDFHESDLPWRYSPKAPANDASAAPTRLSPWIVLLVGNTDELNVQGGIVQPAPAVLADHDLSTSYRWAHVQNDNGVLISRLLSPRVLVPLSSYVAVLVPAFNSAGAPNWTAAGLSGSFLPVFYSWRFQTGEQGDFETLAAALRVRKTQSLGIAAIRYHRPLAGVEVTLSAGGAITSLQNLPDQSVEIAKAKADLDKVNDPLGDELLPGEIPATPLRQIMQLPRYGALWLQDTDAVAWSKSMNDDPRHRGVAGIGLEMGIVAQESLMSAAVEQAGALQDIGQRIGFLALGLGMSAQLWRRRLPESAELQLRIFGPAMGRIMTDRGGTVLDRVTSSATLLDRVMFSSAAMRLSRNGTTRARHMKEGWIDRAALLSLANEPQPPSPDVPPGLPHIDAITDRLGMKPVGELLPGAKFDGDVERLIRKFNGQLVTRQSVDDFTRAAGETLGLNCSDYMTVYFVALAPTPLFFERDILVGALNACRGQKLTPEQRKKHLDGLLPSPVPPDRRRPVNLPPLATAVGDAIDPTQSRPPAWVRVAGTIEGIDLVSLAPPEAPIGLDYPTWTLLKKNEPEWLLPGVGKLQSDSVVALRTNPTFIDSFMVGINTQFLAEMRWRNLPAPRVSTPLRMFWGYVNFALGKREADIQPVSNWPSRPSGQAGADGVGDLSHQAFKPGDTSGKEDLIIAFRTALFRRYPSTLVYLVRPPHGPDGQPVTGAALDQWLTNTPDFSESPSQREGRHYFGPIFQGEVQPDVVFFAFDVKPGALHDYWLVLDEPPAELRFRNERGFNWNNSSEFAVKTIDHPTRVAISGKELESLAVNL
jgi:hypothetical protein